MDSNTGKLYGSKEEALKDGVLLQDVIQMAGGATQIRKVSEDVQARNKARRKKQKAARKKNR